MRTLLRALLPAPIRRPLRRSMDTIRAWAIYLWILRPGLRRTAFPLRGRKANLHVFLVAWEFPPRITGGVYRPVALATYASREGVAVTVVAGPAPAEPSPAGRYLAEWIPDDVAVRRARDVELWPSRRAVPKLDGGFVNFLELTRTVERALRAGRPDVIMASGPPFHSFVAAYLVARRHGIPLVLEYRDEWTECPFDFVRPGRGDRGWERRCLAAADLVIFTTESHLVRALDVFPELDRARSRVIPNGWDPEHWPTVGPYRTGGGPAEIAFLGHLGNHTLPGSFLEALLDSVRLEPDLRQRVRLRFIGQKSRQATEQLASFPDPSMIEAVPLLPKAEAAEVMQRSAGLLLINERRLHRYIPGKLYEYVAAGRPILVYGAGGEVDHLVTSLNAGTVVPEGDAAALARALHGIASGGWTSEGGERRRQWLAANTRETAARRTIRAIRAIGSGGGTETENAEGRDGVHAALSSSA